MNQQWYKSAPAKGILIMAAHVLAAVTAAGLTGILYSPMLRTEVLAGRTAEKYEDTVSFEYELRSVSANVLSGIGTKKLLEVDGVCDTERIVDIQEFQENFRISGENVSGLAYSFEELKAWGEEWEKSGKGEYQTGSNLEDHIIVCKKPDNTYHYYYYSEFRKLIDNGELRFVIVNDDSGISEDDILSDLREGSFYKTSETSFKGLQDAEGKVVYIDCWSYDGYWFEEMYPPVGAKSIMKLANDNPGWNGRLSDAYSMLHDVIVRFGSEISRYENMGTLYQEGDTNVVYLYIDRDTRQVYTNRKEWGDYIQAEKNIEKLRNMGKYVIVRPKLEDFDSNLEDTNAQSWRDSVKYSGGAGEDFIFAIGVDTAYPIKDSFYTDARLYEKYGSNIRAVALLLVVMTILFAGIMIWLTVVAGRDDKDQELHLSTFDHWKTEPAALLVVAVWVIPMYIMGMNISSAYEVTEVSQEAGYGAASYVRTDLGLWAGIAAAYTCGIFLIGYLSLVRRIKAKILWKDSVLNQVFLFARQLLFHMHMVWKAVLIFGLFVVVHWMGFISGRNGYVLFLMLVMEFCIFVYMVKQAIGRQQIDRGVEKIAGGEIDYKIPTDGMGEEQRSIAEKINSIGQGLDTALAESVKSERLKTDLITNVSHDIKTPLTSIINYVNLLKQENFEDPRLQRYIEVLDQKSQRLKTLTEDVVEASKISSGNITLEFMNINLVEMIQQTSGEFEEKFKEKNLTEIMTLPEHEVVICVDGRRLWRVLANIYNNAAKYAMEGTRVYADLYISGNTVIFSLKNVSDQPLNISADELTERFIRGDISRSTEGSGLGLSIAKTLTQMQGGRFELYLDGDLFRVTITFPLALR